MAAEVAALAQLDEGAGRRVGPAVAVRLEVVVVDERPLPLAVHRQRRGVEAADLEQRRLDAVALHREAAGEVEVAGRREERVGPEDADFSRGCGQ